MITSSSEQVLEWLIKELNNGFTIGRDERSFPTSNLLKPLRAPASR